MASSSNDGEFVENNNYERDDCVRASEEDTEDASETEAEKRDEEFTGIKEQMYQDQLGQLKRQKQQLKDGTHPQMLKKMKKLEQQYDDTLRLIDIRWEAEIQKIKKHHEEEINAAKQEFEDKKIELKDALVLDLEHKKKQIEHERLTMDLAGGIFCQLNAIGIKQVNTRKLRRRPYDPAPVPEKRSKPSPVQLGFEIDEEEKSKDMMLINKVCKPKVQQTVAAAQPQRGSLTRSHM